MADWMTDIVLYIDTDFGKVIVAQFDKWRRREASQWTHNQTSILQVVSVMIS